MIVYLLVCMCVLYLYMCSYVCVGGAQAWMCMHMESKDHDLRTHCHNMIIEAISRIYQERQVKSARSRTPSRKGWGRWGEVERFSGLASISLNCQPNNEIVSNKAIIKLS